ncbi:MAG: ATP synthase F1 subunit delta [Elusimicrobia bacterium]|nr:ATP synthase F1 subunit delta [Elusimicrobiota bacterium]
MQLSDRALARRYASALYLSAAGAQESEKVGAELARASRALAARMAEFRHPRTSTADKKAALRAELGDTVSKRVLRFLELLIEKKRFALLPAMAGDFQRLSDEGAGLVHASVKTARPLTEVDSKLLSERLGAFLGKRVLLDVKEDPELMAGVSVRVGDWVLDGSLKGKLRALGARLAGN